jgi:nucleoside phosphorylase
VALLCATRHEAAAARSVQRGAVRPLLLGGRRATLARLGPYSCLTVLLGFPCPDLEAVLAPLAAAFTPRLTLNFGAAGAVDPDLSPGTLTIPFEGVLYRLPGPADREPGAEKFPTDIEQQKPSEPGPGKTRDTNPEVEEIIPFDMEPFRRALREGPGSSLDAVRFTRAGTCPTPVCDDALRDRLRATLGLDTTDCETALLARFCARHGWPFAALRCVTDRAGAHAVEEYRRTAQPILTRAAQTLEPLVHAWFNETKP